MYYAAKNSYSNETSIGFWNTWYVVGFATKAARDAHVKKCPELATRAIKSNEIKKYDGKQGQIGYFDKNNTFFQHMGHGEFCKMVN